MTRPRPSRLVLVTGTGTGVGKTWVASALLACWRAHGLTVAARKPAQSFDATEGTGRTDAEILAEASRESPAAVCRAHRWYEVPFAPPIAAEALGRRPFSTAELVGEISWPEPPPDVGVVELAGGVRSPQACDGDGVDLSVVLRPDAVVLVGDAGLGVINAVRLSYDALAAVASPSGSPAPVWVVLSRFDGASDLHRRNRAWLSRDLGSEVVTVSDRAGAGELDALARRILTNDS